MGPALTTEPLPVARADIDTDPGADASMPPARTGGFDLAAVLGLALALVGAGIGASKLSDNSFLTHLATGRHVVDHGFLTTDVFTWTSAGEPVVVQSWLASSLYGLVDAAAGFQGLRVLMAVTAAALAWSCWTLTERSSSIVTRLLVMVPVLAIGLRTWTERPLLLGLLLLAATLLVVEGRGRTWWLAIVGLVWIGVHGSWPLGLVLLAARWFGARLDGRSGDRELHAGAWLAGGLLIGGVVNPYGPALLLFPLELLGRQDTLAHVAEWKAPDFQSLWTRAFLVLAIAAVVAIGRRVEWRTAVPALLFLALALTSRRNIPVATIVLLPAIAAGMPAIGSLVGSRRSDAIRLAGGALTALLVLLPLLAIRGPHVDADRYPVEAIDALEAAGLGPATTRVVHPDFVGNYLGLRYGDAGAAWIDDRFELHDTSLVEDYLVLLDGSAGWSEALDRDGAEALLWRTDAPLTELTGSVAGWETVWADDDWTVLCRPSAC